MCGGAQHACIKCLQLYGTKTAKTCNGGVPAHMPYCAAHLGTLQLSGSLFAASMRFSANRPHMSAYVPASQPVPTSAHVCNWGMNQASSPSAQQAAALSVHATQQPQASSASGCTWPPTTARRHIKGRVQMVVDREAILLQVATTWSHEPLQVLRVRPNWPLKAHCFLARTSQA